MLRFHHKIALNVRTTITSTSTGVTTDYKALMSATPSFRFFSTLPAKKTPVKEAAASAAKSVTDEQAFTIRYLTRFCKLTPEAATKASQRVVLKSREGPDKVLSLFKERGFSSSQISSLLTKRPFLIGADADRILKPKFEFFASLGAAPDAVAKIFFDSPELFKTSVDNCLVPTLEFLRGFMRQDVEVLNWIVKYRRHFRMNLPVVLGSKIEILKNAGAGDRVIRTFVKHNLTGMLIPKSRFKELVEKVNKMGVSPTKGEFVEAVSVLALAGDEKWESFVGVFEKWGCSEAQVEAAFVKCPRCVMAPIGTIEQVLEYLVQTMELDPSFVAETPNVLMVSVKGRIIPRCTVVRYLVQMGVVMKEDLDFSSILLSSEQMFQDCYLRKYFDVLPELPDLYTLCKNLAAKGQSQPL